MCYRKLFGKSNHKTPVVDAQQGIPENMKSSWNKLWPDQIAQPEEENADKNFKLNEIWDNIPGLNDVTNEKKEWVKLDNVDLGYKIF